MPLTGEKSAQRNSPRSENSCCSYDGAGSPSNMQWQPDEAANPFMRYGETLINTTKDRDPLSDWEDLRAALAFATARL
jgi:hypothetical protein